MSIESVTHSNKHVVSGCNLTTAQQLRTADVLVAPKGHLVDFGIEACSESLDQPHVAVEQELRGWLRVEIPLHPECDMHRGTCHLIDIDDQVVPISSHRVCANRLAAE